MCYADIIADDMCMFWHFLTVRTVAYTYTLLLHGETCNFRSSASLNCTLRQSSEISFLCKYHDFVFPVQSYHTTSSKNTSESHLNQHDDKTKTAYCCKAE